MLQWTVVTTISQDHATYLIKRAVDRSIRPVVHTGMSHWHTRLQPKQTSDASAAQLCARKRRRLRMDRSVCNGETLLHERPTACLLFKIRPDCFQYPLGRMHTLQVKTSPGFNDLSSVTTAAMVADMEVVVVRMVVRRIIGIATAA